jgi:hypothetical protein
VTTYINKPSPHFFKEVRFNRMIKQREENTGHIDVSKVFNKTLHVIFMDNLEN